MRDPVRFIIVTDNAEEALARSFGCARTNAPDFARIMTDPIEIDHIPDGTKVHGLFYCSRFERSPAYDAFISRWSFGGLVYLDDADYEYVRHWVALHKAAAEERARRYPDTPAEPVIAPEESTILKPPPQIEKLVLSQRWS